MFFFAITRLAAWTLTTPRVPNHQHKYKYTKTNTCASTSNQVNLGEEDSHVVIHLLALTHKPLAQGPPTFSTSEGAFNSPLYPPPCSSPIFSSKTMCSPVSSHRPQNLQPGELTFPILTLDGTEMGISGNCTPTSPGYTEDTRSGSIAFPNLLHFFLGTSTDGTYIRIYLHLPTYINLHTSAVFQTLPYVCSTYLASMYIKHHTTSLARILSSKEKYTQVA